MCGTATAMTKTATTISVTAATRTITDSAAGFDTNKFRVGEKITTTGFTTPANNLTGIIAAVSASEITLTEATTDLVDEAAGASVTITSGTLRLIAGTTRRTATYVRHHHGPISLLPRRPVRRTFHRLRPEEVQHLFHHV